MDAHELAEMEFWTEDEAREVVAILRRSGESIATFARRIGTSPSRISYWSRKLGPARAATAPRRDGAGSRSKPVRSASDPKRRADRGGAIEIVPVTVLAPPPGRISVELRSGRVIRIEGDVDEAAIVRAIVAAERAGC